jgi:hypothetical protein
MTKDEALKMAIELMERFLEHDSISSSDYIDVRNACIKALEPTVAELNDEYLRDTHVEGFTSIEQFISELEADRDEWKQSTITANRRFEIAEEANTALEARNKELVDALELLKSHEHSMASGRAIASKALAEQPTNMVTVPLDKLEDMQRRLKTSQEPVALLEALSDLEHQQWIKWAKSIIDSELISEARKQRWLTMMIDYKDLPDNIQEYDREWARKVMALYTHPPKQWQGLSDEEIDDVWNNVQKYGISLSGVNDKFIRAVEAKLKEKNL